MNFDQITAYVCQPLNSTKVWLSYYQKRWSKTRWLHKIRQPVFVKFVRNLLVYNILVRTNADHHLIIVAAITVQHRFLWKKRSKSGKCCKKLGGKASSTCLVVGNKWPGDYINSGHTLKWMVFEKWRLFRRNKTPRSLEFLLTRTQKKQCIVHRQKILFLLL